MKLKKSCIFMIVLFMMFVSIAIGCQREENPEENNSQEKEMPEAIEELESGALEIMSQADMIPVVDRGDREEQQEITFDETLLTEVLRKEEDAGSGGGTQGGEDEQDNQELPQDTEEIWDNIKKTIAQLHSNWDELEPQLNDENVSRDVITEFEETLDSLTILSTEQDYFATLIAANRLTQYLSQFRAPFSEDSSPTAYGLKYQVRNVVLAAVANDYQDAQESLDILKEQGQELTTDLMEQDADEVAAEYNTSVNNLQRALDKKDLDLIKINAAVVMENVTQMIEELEG